MDIYIKCNTKYIIEEKRQIRVQDIAEVIAPPQLVNKIQQLKLLEVPVSKQKTYVISIMDIIKKIKNDFPDVEITNIGSEDILIEYHPQKIKESKIWLYVKVAFIAFIVLTGSTVAIISFHEDVNMAKVFQDIYKIFMGKKDHPILTKYCIRWFNLGIVHFSIFTFIRFSQEPTPISKMSL